MGKYVDRTMVLLSGGLDSATALAWAIEQHGKEDVHGITFKYGQKHSKEVQCSLDVSRYYDVDCIVVPLDFLCWKKSGCTLIEGNDEVDESTYAEQLDKSNGQPIATSVPFRNGVFLSVATAWAMSYGYTKIVIGTHQDDSGAVYPDCSPSFIDSIRTSIWYGTNHQVYLSAPFSDLTKDEIVRWGLVHKVPYKLTWSCYKGGEKACGKCATCRDRLKAFRMNGSSDPIEYERSKK